MKRKLFIGSSTKGLSVANKLKTQINTICRDWIVAEVWKDGNIFSLNKNALDSLVKASRQFDYGIMVATKDDILKSKRKTHSVPRDNVMFEMGMFLGSLGLTRAFLLVEKENKLPTDYNGVTVPYFQKGKAGSLDKAIGIIVKALTESKNSYNLKPVPSAALALGYFDNFILPLAKRMLDLNIDYKLEIILPKNINDLFSAKIKYLNMNPSSEVSVYGDGTRPIVMELKSQRNYFWDFPTTLSTLKKLMDMIIPSPEIGTNHEKKDWIEHELRNFKGTLEMLITDTVSCNGNVTVTFL